MRVWNWFPSLSNYVKWGLHRRTQWSFRTTNYKERKIRQRWTVDLHCFLCIEMYTKYRVIIMRPYQQFCRYFLTAYKIMRKYRSIILELIYELASNTLNLNGLLMLPTLVWSIRIILAYTFVKGMFDVLIKKVREQTCGMLLWCGTKDK